MAARKKAAADAEQAKAKLHQQTLDPHLREKPERVVPYSDALFREAAVEWLIATDQVSFSTSFDKIAQVKYCSSLSRP